LRDGEGPPGNSADLDELKRLIIQRTEGNPFFIEEMVQALFDQDALVRNSKVEIVRPPSQLRLPATVQGILASRIDRLPREHKELLQTLAVMGRESPLELIRQVTSRSEGKLDPLLSALQASEFIYDQPSAGGMEYIFKHALTQEVAYNSLLIERRKFLHERTGAAMEALYADRLDDYLSRVAHQYQRSGNSSKALEYLGRAAQQAAGRSAHAEAIELFTAALALLTSMPDTPEQIQQELALQLGLASALTALKGFSAVKVGRVLDRASKICRQIGSAPQLFRVRAGLSQFYAIRGQLSRAHELAQELLTIAESAHDTILQVWAHFFLGHYRSAMGKFVEARNHLEYAISLYDPPIARHTEPSIPFMIRALLPCVG
jgi:predicted ATPase